MILPYIDMLLRRLVYSSSSLCHMLLQSYMGELHLPLEFSWRTWSVEVQMVYGIQNFQDEPETRLVHLAPRHWWIAVLEVLGLPGLPAKHGLNMPEHLLQEKTHIVQWFQYILMISMSAFLHISFCEPNFASREASTSMARSNLRTTGPQTSVAVKVGLNSVVNLVLPSFDQGRKVRTKLMIAYLLDVYTSHLCVLLVFVCLIGSIICKNLLEATQSSWSQFPWPLNIFQHL